MKKFMKKPLAIILAVVLLVGAVIGGTLAWFTAKTQTVENTFTVGNIGVELTETDSADEDDDPNKNSYKMIPGWTIDKDPKAKITSGSEYGYLFVEVNKSSSVDAYLDYAIHTDWTSLDGVDGVYYIVINTADKINNDYSILGAGTKPYEGVNYSWNDDQVLVKPTVTKEMMQNITDGKVADPVLTFNAYAVQLYKNNTEIFEPAEAWAIAKP